MILEYMGGEIQSGSSMTKHKNRSRGWNWHQKIRVSVIFLVLSLILIVFVVLFHGNTQKPSSSFSQRLKWDSFDYLVRCNPTRELWNGIELIWQIPDSPKAVLFLAHGCNCKAVNFWDKSTECPHCIGLPEDRLLVLHALARNISVMTISSKGRCWTIENELVNVKNAISRWVVKNKLEELPLMAMGVSSGGYFVSMLATEMKFKGIALMIAEGLFDQIEVKESYPPTLFVHMPKDETRRRNIDRYMIALRKKGLDVGEIKCFEFPLSSHLLADRIPGVDFNASSKLFQMFKDKGFVDGNGYLKKDGRATRWKEAFLGDEQFRPVNHLAQHIQEELNVAFALHEITGRNSDEILRWFESHM